MCEYVYQLGSQLHAKVSNTPTHTHIYINKQINSCNTSKAKLNKIMLLRAMHMSKGLP